MSRSMLIRFGLFAVLGAAFLAFRSSAERAGPKDDEAIESLLAKPGATEALAWLEKAPPGTRTVGGGEKEYDHSRALKLVRELYRRGARKVTAIDVVVDSDPAGREWQYTDTLIVELPDDPAIRKKLFEVDAAEVQPEYGPAVESGQRYFMMWWD